MIGSNLEFIDTQPPTAVLGWRVSQLIHILADSNAVYFAACFKELYLMSKQKSQWVTSFSLKVHLFN